MNITSNGGNIGRIHWINGDLSQSDRERMECYLANKYGIVQHLLYGQPVIPRFGRVWWGDGSDQLKVTPLPTEWTPALLELTRGSWYSADDGLYVDSSTGQQFLRDLSGNGGRMNVVVNEIIVLNKEVQ